MTFYINGTKVRDLRGQAPKGDWRFGLSGDNFDKQKNAEGGVQDGEGHQLSSSRALSKLTRS